MVQSVAVHRPMESWTESGERDAYRTKSGDLTTNYPSRTRRRRPRALLSAGLAVVVTTHTITASASSDHIVSNQTSGICPEAPSSRLPWVVLTPDDSGRLNGDGTCLGLLITRRAALMAASCVEQYRQTQDVASSASIGSVAVALGRNSDVEVADITRPSPSGCLRLWRRRDGPRVAIHAKYAADPLAYDVALVQWDDAIDAPSAHQAPVVLDDRGQWMPDDKIATVVDAEEAYEAAVESTRSTVCPVGVECVEAAWDQNVSCVSIQRQSGFVYRLAEDRVFVSGLVAQTLDCSDSDAAASTRSHVTVASLANARSFIDATLRDAEWMDVPGVPQGSGSGATAVDVEMPASQDGNKGDGSEPGDDIDVGFVEDPAPSVQVWRTNLMDKYGYLSRHGDLPDDAQLLVDGGVAVILAPQFVLTRASWIRGLEEVHWVYLATQIIRIKRVLSQDTQDNHADRLVIVELERAIDEERFSSVEIPTTLPPKYKDLRALATAAFTGDAFVTMGYNALDDRSLCGLPANTTDELVCVTSSERANWYAPFLPFNTSFLLMDQFLVGLSQGPSSTGQDLRLAQTFEPLGASRSIRSFLDEATNGTVVWTEKEVYTVAADPYIFGETVLYSNASSLEDGLLPCGVVPLTRRFFLTMASCLGNEEIAWVVYHPAEEEAPSPVDEGAIVELDLSAADKTTQKNPKHREKSELQKKPELKKKPSHQRRQSDSSEPPRDPMASPSWRPKNAVGVKTVYVHPIYEATQSPKYDFAIIECAEDIDQAGFSTVRLMGEALVAHARVVEHRLGSDSSDDEASLVVDVTECANANAAANSAACVAATSSSPRCHTKESTPEPRPDHGTQSLFYRVGVDVMFVGFFKAHEAGSNACDARRAYSQVVNILNFVNAVVVKPEWSTAAAETDAAVYKPGFSAPVGVSEFHKPYVVGLRLTKSGQNFCGGSLIAPQFVLTAAHCVTDGLAAWVAIGSSVSSGIDTEPIPIDKARTRIHPEYQSPYAYSHDAAILELTMPAYETAIALDTSQDFRDGAPATMYGYGVESATSTVLSPVLHARQLALLSRKTCATTLPNIDDAVVCALAASGLDACTGDSGSPLVVQDDRAPGGERLVGVVSAGYGCGVAGVPGLYTRVASIAEFVNAYAVSPVWVGTGNGGDSPGSTDEVDDEPRTRSPSPTPAVTSVSGVATRTPSGTGTSATEGGGGTPVSAGGNDDDSTSTSSNGQSTTDVSQLPLEDRNGIPSGAVASSVLTPANATFVAAIRKTPLSSGSVTAFTKAELLQFLLGDYPYSFVAPQLLDALASPTNAVTFYSSGDVVPLLRVLSAHDAKPLSQRPDRFLSASRMRHARTQVQCV